MTRIFIVLDSQVKRLSRSEQRIIFSEFNMLLTKAKKNEIKDFLKHPERLDKLMKKAGNYSDGRGCYGRLRKNLASLGVHGTIHYYGSRLMKMGVKASDLDIFIDLG